MNYVNNETLIQVLSKMLGTKTISADYETEQLQGGTLGDVKLVTGLAITPNGEKMPYKVVWKRQKQWERSGDTDSWRREYDLYKSDLGKVFTDSLRWPECYETEINSEKSEIQIWMEYIEGVSGCHLTTEMLEQAALELGRFQGKSLKDFNNLQNINCLGDTDFLEREFAQWHTQWFTYDYLVSEPCQIPEFLKLMLKEGDIQLVDGKSFEYSFLRSKVCNIPLHLKKMLINIDNHKDEILSGFKDYPVVLCHRDFWNENIFYSDGKIRLIDWDTASWGFVGEDISSLIVDGMGVEKFEENCRRLIPAYLIGLSERMDVPNINKKYILTMTLIKFGYRMMQEYMFWENPDEKIGEIWGVNALQKIYDIMDLK